MAKKKAQTFYGADEARYALYEICRQRSARNAVYGLIHHEDLPYLYLTVGGGIPAEEQETAIELEELYHEWWFAISAVILNDARLRIQDDGVDIAMLRRFPERRWDEAAAWRPAVPDLAKVKKRLQSALVTLDGFENSP